MSRWNQSWNSLFVALALALLPASVMQAADDDHPAGKEHVTTESETHDNYAAGDHAESSHDGHGDDSHSGNGHDDAEHKGHGTGHGDAHHEPYSIFADLSFWALIAFIGFCFAIYKLGLWDSLLTNMSAREKNEQKLIDDAESHLSEAHASLNAFKGQFESMDETIKETLAEAERDATHTQNEIIALANREAGASLDRARLQVERVRDQSLLDIFNHVANRVGEATEARLRENLSTEDQDRLIDETLNQLTHS